MRAAVARPIGWAVGLLLVAVGCGPSQWRTEEVNARMSYFGQEGRGAQSQADVQEIDGVERGDERLDVYQPSFRVALRQNDRVRHTLDMPIDIVTSASADALDAVSTASKVNEAVELDLRTQWRATDNDEIQFRIGAHIEEYLKGGFGGIRYLRELADDNATIEAGVDLTVDAFDPLTPQGFDLGHTSRQAFHAWLGGSQVLSRTTLARAGYDLTYQWGRLEQTWNSVPVPRPFIRPAELFPGTRLRHVLSGSLSQHIPQSRSTLMGAYRYYRDDFGVIAHTLDLEASQWMGSHVYVRVGYRLHDQGSPDFFTTEAAPTDRDDGTILTADSDLAAFRAHEWSVKVVLFTSLDEARGRESVYISYHRYERPYLDVGVVSVGYRWLR